MLGWVTERARRPARDHGRQRARQNRRQGQLDDHDAVQRRRGQDDDGAERGLDKARVQRLTISEKVLNSMIQGCREVAAMADPVGEIESMKKRPNGMLVGRMRVPLGVVAMIYESRPNATVDAGILCLKAGNAVILRGRGKAKYDFFKQKFNKWVDCVTGLRTRNTEDWFRHFLQRGFVETYGACPTEEEIEHLLLVDTQSQKHEQRLASAVERRITSRQDS